MVLSHSLFAGEGEFPVRLAMQAGLAITLNGASAIATQNRRAIIFCVFTYKYYKIESSFCGDMTCNPVRISVSLQIRNSTDTSGVQKRACSGSRCSFRTSDRLLPPLQNCNYYAVEKCFWEGWRIVKTGKIMADVRHLLFLG